MIHSASPQSRLAVIVAEFWSFVPDVRTYVRTDGRTTCVKIVITTGRDCGRPRGSILIFQLLLSFNLFFPTFSIKSYKNPIMSWLHILSKFFLHAIEIIFCIDFTSIIPGTRLKDIFHLSPLALLSIIQRKSYGLPDTTCKTNNHLCTGRAWWVKNNN